MALGLGNVEGMEHLTIPLGYSDNSNVDGLQEAHIYGKNFWTRALKNLLDTIDPNGLLDADSSRNGFHALESKAGGMATGVSVHNGRQQDAYDALAYDEVAPSTSKQFLNVFPRA